MRASGRFAGEHAVVVGAGVAGAAAASVLRREGAEVLVTEARPATTVSSVGDLEALGVQVRAGGHDPSHLDGATLVVTGPGVPESAPVLTWARDRGLPVWGEMELGARLCRVPYLAVTGTNGKTTVTAMIAEILRADGVAAVACGNIGHPFPSAATEEHDVLVVECSSFQLRFQRSLHPRVSVLLNLAPDHLDWHGSYEAYVDAKATIFRNQGAQDVHVGNRDDVEARAISARAPCPIVWTTAGPPEVGEVGFVEGELVERAAGVATTMGPIADERAGFRADAAAAAAAALAFGAGAQAVRVGLSGFRPAAHRGETVATVDGVRFVDNSKATNVHAAVAAIRAEPGAVLIAGGRAKGVDLRPFGEVADRLAGVVAIGEAAPDLVRVFTGRVAVEEAGTIEEAVAVAVEMARPHGHPVLLAPGCASWDQFTDYAERGDRFAAAARSLIPEVTDARP
jgi:UDP-N-acetylmuramoylalanine--D-glutamate ligase